MTLKIKNKPPSPKTKKEPKHLSLDALGLLTHMREHRDTDGSYSWGVMKTADFFGIDHRRIREAYQELDEAKQTTTVQSGKDPKTGKNLLVIVKPHGTNPLAYAPLESSPLEPSSGTSAPLYVITQSIGSRSVSTESTSMRTEDEWGTNATGPDVNVPLEDQLSAAEVEWKRLRRLMTQCPNEPPDELFQQTSAQGKEVKRLRALLQERAR